MFGQRNRRTKVSVVMTVYRPDPVFLSKAVQSILGQTHDDFELIIVEDPSSDQSCQSTLHGLQDGRIRHISNRLRTHLVAQKNCGLLAARSPLVAFMDADDIAHPRRLAEQVAFLDSHPDVTVVGSQIAAIDIDDHIIGYRRFPELHYNILQAMPRVVPFCHPSVMLRRDAVLEAGGYQFLEYPAAEDYELWSRLSRRGIRFANHPEVLLYYRVHGGQMKATFIRQTILGVLRVKELYWSERSSLMATAWRWAERLLLYLPGTLAVRLVQAWLYRDRPPAVSAFGPVVPPKTFLRDASWTTTVFSSLEPPDPERRCSNSPYAVTPGS